MVPRGEWSRELAAGGGNSSRDPAPEQRNWRLRAGDRAARAGRPALKQSQAALRVSMYGKRHLLTKGNAQCCLNLL